MLSNVRGKSQQSFWTVFATVLHYEPNGEWLLTSPQQVFAAKLCTKVCETFAVNAS